MDSGRGCSQRFDAHRLRRPSEYARMGVSRCKCARAFVTTGLRAEPVPPRTPLNPPRSHHPPRSRVPGVNRYDLVVGTARPRFIPRRARGCWGARAPRALCPAAHAGASRPSPPPLTRRAAPQASVIALCGSAAGHRRDWVLLLPSLRLLTGIPSLRPLTCGPAGPHGPKGRTKAPPI